MVEMQIGGPSRLALASIAVVLLVLLIPVFIGVYVYRDAKSRRMSAVAWTLIAVFAPALVGFIIYLLVRGGRPDLECSRCGARVTEQFVVCPQCGTKLRPVCSNCSAPVERDWKVCPHCAAPLDGVREEVASPRRRQDKALGRVLVVVIVVPVLLVVMALASYMVRPQTGSGSMREVTFDEYDRLQPSETVRNAVYRWLDYMDVRTDRAYALRYDLPGEYDYENKHYYLIYVPGGGQRGHGTATEFGLGSGLFAPTLELGLERTGDSGSLFCVEITSEKTPTPKITLNGRRIRCDVWEVEYNPTTFLIYPDYSQLKPEEVLFLPERISVTKLERIGEGSSQTVDTVGVTDKDTLFKLMSAMDGGERLDWEHPIYAGCDISGGFQVIIEYEIKEYIPFESTLRAFRQDGVCYLIDNRIRHGDNFRLMDGAFYALLESLFEEGASS